MQLKIIKQTHLDTLKHRHKIGNNLTHTFAQKRRHTHNYKYSNTHTFRQICCF